MRRAKKSSRTPERRHIDRDAQRHDRLRRAAGAQQQPRKGQVEQHDAAEHLLVAADVALSLYAHPERSREGLDQGKEQHEADERHAVGRGFDEPQLKDERRTEQHREGKEQHEEVGEPRGLEYEGEEAAAHTARAGLDDLRIGRRLETAHQARDPGRDLPRNGPCGIDRHAAEDVEQEVQPLLHADVGRPAQRVPSREAQDPTEERPVADRRRAATVVAAAAKEDIGPQHDQIHGGDQPGVEHQAVAPTEGEQPGGSQVERRLEQAQVGIERHTLVGDDRRIEGDDEELGHEREERELKDPPGGRHPPGGDVELRGEEPDPERLGRKEQHHGQHGMDLEAHREGPPGRLQVAAPQVGRPGNAGCSATMPP